jgi:hypothetical protein
VGHDGAERDVRKRIVASRDQPGGCVLRLTAAERTLLARLPREIDGVLAALPASAAGGPGESGSAESSLANLEVGLPPTDGTVSLPPSLKRLFPPAFTRDDDAEREYIDTARPALLEHHRHALQTLAETASAKSLDAEQIQDWMTALNDIRLVLGTVLGVTEDTEPAGGRMSQQALYYYYLSGLQTELIDFLSGWLPPPVPGADDLIPEDPWGEPLGGLRWDGTPQPGDAP